MIHTTNLQLALRIFYGEYIGNPPAPKVPATWPQVGPVCLETTLAQVEAHMVSTWRTWPAQSETQKTQVFTGNGCWG